MQMVKKLIKGYTCRKTRRYKHQLNTGTERKNAKKAGHCCDAYPHSLKLVLPYTMNTSLSLHSTKTYKQREATAMLALTPSRESEFYCPVAHMYDRSGAVMLEHEVQFSLRRSPGKPEYPIWLSPQLLKCKKSKQKTCCHILESHWFFDVHNRNYFTGSMIKKKKGGHVKMLIQVSHSTSFDFGFWTFHLLKIL